MKKSFLLLIFFYYYITLFAQNTSIDINIKQDTTQLAHKDTTKFKRYQPALILGPTIVRIGINPKNNNGTQNDVAETDIGFNIGFGCRINLSKRLYLMPQAALYFQGSSLSYNTTTKKFDAKASFKPLTLDIPIHLIWKWNEKKRITPAFHIGARYIGDISSSSTKSVGIKSSDMAVEAGIGLEIRIWKISIMPRVGAVLGLANLLNEVETSGLYDSIRRQKFEIGFMVF